jgi:hypothetical protein
MSDEERITLRIRRDGTVQGQTLGIKGSRCLAYIDVLRDLIAAEAVDSHFTEEYYEHADEESARHDVRLEHPTS